MYKMVGQCGDGAPQAVEEEQRSEQAGVELRRKPKPIKGCNAAVADNGVMKYTTVCYSSSF